MATEVSLVGNILKIDDSVKVKYFNASWCTMDFTDDSVIITDEGRGENNSASIAFTDFFDDTPTAYATEALISAYLSDKIG